MPITRLSLDGYGARRAGDFSGKAITGPPGRRLVNVSASDREIISDATDREIAR